MITIVLIVVASIAILLTGGGIVAWAIQREPAGHGQHAMRREPLALTEADLPLHYPDPLTSHNQRAGYWPNERHAIPARIVAALAGAKPHETVIDGITARDAWETGTVVDPWEGFGDAEGYVKALFAGKVQVPA